MTRAELQAVSPLESQSKELRQVFLNDSTVYSILKHGGTLEQCVITIAKQKADLVQRVIDLESIAPKKIRMSDGTVRIWRCPDELVP